MDASVVAIKLLNIQFILALQNFSGFNPLQFLLNNWPDLLALVTGVLGVWLTIKQNIWCWPMALISVLVSLGVFYQQRLYGDMTLQIVYFFAGLYGWIYWNKNKDKAFKVTRTEKRLIPILISATALQAIAYYFLLLYFKGDKPIMDALLTAGSLTATYMMTKKWLGNWMIWVIIDGSYILLYAMKEMWLFALLYFLFTLMALTGWLKWKNIAS